MKTIFTFLIALFLTSMVIGQGYPPVQIGISNYYSNPVTAQFAATGLQQNFEHFIRIDSQSTVGNTTQYFNHPTKGDDTLTSCDFHPNGNSWLGSSFSDLGNGQWLAFNASGDSILFQVNTQLGNSWKMYKWPNGDYIQAILGSSYANQTLGQADSLYNMVFQTKNSQGQDITHPINGFTLKISKIFGFYQIFDISQFPLNVLELQLEGSNYLASGVPNPGFLDLYDLQVGDEIHVKLFENQGASTGYQKLNHSRRITLSRYLSPNQDTLILETEVLWHDETLDYNTNITTTTTGRDTVTELFHNQQPLWQRMTTLPTDTKVPSIAHIGNESQVPMIYDDRFNQRMLKSSGGFYQYDSSSNCYTEIIVGGVETWDFSIEGLGGNYFSSVDLIFFSLFERWPIYFKKGAETWGTPWDFAANVAVNQNLPNLELKIFPNPALDRVKVMLPEGEWKLKLFDTFQREVKTISGRNRGECEVELQGLAPGIYFLQAENLEGQRGVAKVLKR